MSGGVSMFGAGSFDFVDRFRKGQVCLMLDSLILPLHLLQGPQGQMSDSEESRCFRDEAGVGSLLILRDNKPLVILGNNFRQIVTSLVENPAALVAEPVSSPRSRRVCRCCCR